jgi:hypothetical protein
LWWSLNICHNYTNCSYLFCETEITVTVTLFFKKYLQCKGVYKSPVQKINKIKIDSRASKQLLINLPVL